MVSKRIIAPFLIALGLGSAVSGAELRRINNPAEAAKIILNNGRFDSYKKLLTTCSMEIFADNSDNCRSAVGAVFLGLIAQKKYAEAERLLPKLKGALSGMGVRTPVACVTDIVYLDRYLGQKYYLLGYEQSAFQVARRLNAKNSDKLALRAFLCASYLSKNYKLLTGSAENPPLSRNDFISTIEKIYGKSARYDVARYLDEILVPIFRLQSSMPLNDFASRVSLLKNAAKHADDIGLDSSFGRFLEDMSTEYYYYAKG